jgi:hypothetical protein
MRILICTACLHRYATQFPQNPLFIFPICIRLQLGRTGKKAGKKANDYKVFHGGIDLVCTTKFITYPYNNTKRDFGFLRMLR